MTILDQVLYFNSLKIATIPLQARSKSPETRLLPFGKWETYQSALPSVTDLRHWHHTERQNYGVVAGWHGLTFLDFDDIAEYGRWQVWMHQNASEDIRLRFEYGLKVSTARGVHVYFFLQNRVGLRNRKLPGLDLKLHGYVVGPGCTHASGHVYNILSLPYYIPTVANLSDILPSALLTKTQNAHAAPVNSLPAMPNNDDPWVAVNMSYQQEKLVDAVRRKFRIEDFFTKTRQTSHDGRWFLASCPFHDDATPSFWIDSTRQICNCFFCNFDKPLDVINLYGALYGLDNRSALFALAALL